MTVLFGGGLVQTMYTFMSITQLCLVKGRVSPPSYSFAEKFQTWIQQPKAYAALYDN